MYNRANALSDCELWTSFSDKILHWFE